MLDFDDGWDDDDEDDIDLPETAMPVFEKCPECDGSGVGGSYRMPCQRCYNGLVGFDYEGPTHAPPGSPLRVAVYAARSANGLALFNDQDYGVR